MKEIKLFDYQQEMVQMPTGTGKTYLMAAVVKWFLETYAKGEVWLIAHRKELVEQMERTLDRFALAYGEKNDELKAKVRIRVLSIQWLTRNIGDLEKNKFVPGLIIVATRIDAIPTLIEDGVDGLLVEVDNPQDAADKVLWLYRHPEEAAEMKRKALKKVIENYDISRVVDQHIDMFEKLCDKE